MTDKRNDTRTTNENCPLTLKNVRDRLLDSYVNAFGCQKIQISGNVEKYIDTFYLSDEEGNRVKLYISDDLAYNNQESIPYDGDKITVAGYLNYNRELGEPMLLKNGKLEFWFKVLQITSVERCNESRKILLQRSMSLKTEKNVPVRAYIYHILYSGNKPKILVLCSGTGEEDVKQGVGDSINQYSITFEATPLSNRNKAAQLAEKIRTAERLDYDAIAFSRGGNEAYDIFYEKEVYTTILTIPKYSIAGLGHSTLDEPFLMIFDEVMKTPNEFGHYLKDIALDVQKQKLFERQQEENKKRRNKLIRIVAIIITLLTIVALALWYLNR